MKTRKSKRLKRNIRNFFLLTIFAVLATFAGWFLQRKENLKTRKVEINYKVVDTKKEYKTNLVMVGDALMHMAVNNTYKAGNTYNYEGMFKYIKPIVENYDLAYYNQETILGGVELGLSGYPQFNSPQEVGNSFVSTGFNLVSLATNHSMDNYYRTNGKSIENSVNFWKKYSDKVIAAGSYLSESDREEVIIKEIHGIKYALLSYTEQTNGISVPSGKEYLCNVYSKEKVKNDIERYRDKVDLLMVAMHWGEEYTTNLTTFQKETAKYLASLGVNIIIGCHPHVIQPMDFIDNTLVIYSLGNFVSNQDTVQKLTGLMASCVIKKIEYHGKTTVTLEDVGAEFIYTNKNNRYIVYPYSELNDNILSGYKRYYQEYKNVINRYTDKVTVKGVEV